MYRRFLFKFGISIFLFLIIICPVRADLKKAMDLFVSKDYYAAEQELENLFEIFPGDINNMELLTNVFISQNKFKDAISEIRKIILIDPENEIIITLARLYSWTGEFDNSIEFYDKAILIKSDNIELYIEKARVLGWAGREKEAVNQYASAYKKFNQEWIKYEMLAKQSLWNHRIKDAISYYKESIKFNSKNSEVLFDLAQLYSYLSMNSDADKYYSMLIDVSPYNSAGKKSFYKNKVIPQSPEITIGLNLWTAESKERMTDVEMSSNFISIKKRIKDNYFITLKYIKTNYRNDSQISNDNIAGFLFDYYKGLKTGAGVYYSISNFENTEIKDGDHYTLYSWYKIRQNLDVNLSYKKEKFINNYENIRTDLNVRFADLKADWDINKLFLFTAEFKKGEVSDSNSFFKSNFVLHFSPIQAPRNLYGELEIGKEMYNKNSIQYFAPGDYGTYGGLIGFKHNIGFEGLFYGAKDIFYDIKYKIIQDSNGEISRQPKITLYFDLIQFLSFKLEYTQTDSYYYKDKSYSAILTWYPDYK